MKVIQINSVYGFGSTGRIVEDIHCKLIEEGYQSQVIVGRKHPVFNKEIEQSTVLDFYSLGSVVHHAFFALPLDKHGLYSSGKTREIIEKIATEKPDIIHLHNLHGFYLNYKMLFEYLNTTSIKIIWTLHDCWPFTGYCSHYDYNGCIEWQRGCKSCEYRNVYPYRILSNSKNNLELKKRLFTTNQNLQLVTPSSWLKNEVGNSILKDKKINVITNGIDTTKFFRESTDNELRAQYNIANKKILLGVANIWTKQKGFDEYIKLSKIIDDEYRIVLIGVSSKQIKILGSHENIIGVARINSLDELRQWYSEVNFFVNLTLEDTYPTVNLEAIACGLRVISYATGGSSEIALLYGEIAPKYDIKKIYEIILENKNYELKNSLNDSKIMVEEYLKVYELLMKGE